MGLALDRIFEPLTDRRRYSARRSQLEIQMDILKVVHDGASLPTQIMYRANLAWVALQENLVDLGTNGLLNREMDGSKRSYKLTSKGLQILAGFTQIVESLKDPKIVPKACATCVSYVRTA